MTVKNKLQSIWKEEVLVFLMTASIRNEGVRKGVKDLIQNQIFGCTECEAENLTAQLLRSTKQIFIFTSYACVCTYDSKKACLIKRLIGESRLRLKDGK